MGQRIVVVGASFAGVSAALSLRGRLPTTFEITVVSTRDTFTFLPSLVWVPFGERREEAISFPLRPMLEAQGIRFQQEAATAIHPETKEISTASRRLPYEFLVLATGARAAWEQVPGLGPSGFTQSIQSFEDARHAEVAWERLLTEPGPVVVGAVPRASAFAPAYEFMLNAALRLELRGPQGRMEKTFVTPEPYIGHLGLGGVGATSEKLERRLLEAGVASLTAAHVEAVTPGEIHLAGGKTLPFKFALLMPPLVGADVVKQCASLSDDQGFVPVNEQLRAKGHEHIFVAGGGASFAHESHGAVRAPKSSYQAEKMGRVVAHNVVAAIDGSATKDWVPEERIILDIGGSGLVLGTDNVEDVPGRHDWLITGIEAHWAKVALERWFLATRRHGLG